MMLVGFPPLIRGSILLELERAFGLPFFDVTRGGDPLLWQHLFWMFGHPEVYIIFPARGGRGLDAEYPFFAGRPLVGYTWNRGERHRHGLHQLRTVGPPHVHGRYSAIWPRPSSLSRACWWPCPPPCSSSPGLRPCIAGDPRYDLPMLYLFGFPRHIRDGRVDGCYAGAGTVQLAGPRTPHFRGSPPALCVVWRLPPFPFSPRVITGIRR